MKLSIIIPAYNEEALIGPTLAALLDAARFVGEPFEVTVVDDGSTDRTAEIARQHGARVVSVNYRHIAAVRNAGARQASGDAFVFVDADTLVPGATLLAAVKAMRGGAAGGGSSVEMDRDMPLLGKVYFQIFLAIWRPLRLAAGCFIFAKKDAFEAAGGFDERYFASEEIWLSRALKQQGRFVILRERVMTSSRKVRMHGPLQILRIALRLLWSGPKGWQKREGLDLWYDGQRESSRPSKLHNESGTGQRPVPLK